MSNSDKSEPQLPPSTSFSSMRMPDSGLASSSSAVRPYPPRMNKEGKSPIQNHSMNHYSAMANLAKVKQELGDDVWSHLKKSSIGVFAKFADLDYLWASNRVHYFLINQLIVDGEHEIWSLIDDRPIRFSILEFGDFTGLNCDSIDPSDVCDLRHEEFWREMGISTATWPTFEELKRVMAKSHLWHFDKMLMVGQLCLLSVAVLGIHKGSRIPLDLAKRVLHQESFEKHPWGRVAFKKLIGLIKLLEMSKKSYLLQGPVQVLLTWVYEHVHGIRESYGNRVLKDNEVDPDEVPHLNWHSGRNRYSYQQFIDNEKAAHGKVRVTHMVNLPSGDIYPKWSDDEMIDPLVKNMVEDILSGNLRANAWCDDLKMKKRKVFVRETEDQVGTDDAEMANKKKKTIGKDHEDEDPKDKDVVMLGMYKMVEKLTADLDVMKYLMSDMAKKIVAVEKTNEQQKEEIADMYSKMAKLVEAVETKGNNAQPEEDIGSKKNADDEATSSTPKSIKHPTMTFPVQEW